MWRKKAQQTQELTYELSDMRTLSALKSWKSNTSTNFNENLE